MQDNCLKRGIWILNRESIEEFDIENYRNNDEKIDYKSIFKVIDEDPDLMDKFAKAVKNEHDGEGNTLSWIKELSGIEPAYSIVVRKTYM